jgi:hypothetical protein
MYDVYSATTSFERAVPYRCSALRERESTNRVCGSHLRPRSDLSLQLLINTSLSFLTYPFRTDSCSSQRESSSPSHHVDQSRQ